jgi:hypothetical protein
MIEITQAERDVLRIQGSFEENSIDALLMGLRGCPGSPEEYAEHLDEFVRVMGRLNVLGWGLNDTGTFELPETAEWRDWLTSCQRMALDRAAECEGFDDAPGKIQDLRIAATCKAILDRFPVEVAA